MSAHRGVAAPVAVVSVLAAGLPTAAGRPRKPTGKLCYAIADLAALPRAAVVVEDRY